MGAGELIETLEHFFLDLIGTVIPGTILTVGCWMMLGQPALVDSQPLVPPRGAFGWVLLVAAGYVVGHGLTCLGHVAVKPCVESIARITRRCHLTSRVLPRSVRDEAEIMDEILNSHNYLAMVGEAKRVHRWPQLEMGPTESVHSWRNIAMSIAQDSSPLVYRFMFVSLLNLGVATAFVSLVVAWGALSVLRAMDLVSVSVPFNGWSAVILLVFSLPFLERHYTFYTRSMKVPFSMAAVKLRAEGSSLSVPSPVESSTKGLGVYLAGGFHSGWQDRVVDSMPSLKFFDPREHGLEAPSEYSLWDLEAIRQSDVVFAYLEATNPGGYALALEVGYARALGKHIVFVDEKSAVEEKGGRYLAMVRTSADVVFHSFEEGLAFLRSMEKLS